jgi:cobalamin biosynthesis protein CobT
MNIETILSRPSVRGLEFRLGLEAFAHKTSISLGLEKVTVFWRADVQTAGINGTGCLFLAGVPDESIVSRALVVKYAGYVVHELLHHKYTNFGISADSQYLRVLHNAIEDGWIENTAIEAGLLGNIGPLLGELIDSMTTEALVEVTDWNDPRQYPYVLAVHCRKHATKKCPTNPKLAPIFDEAAKRCLKAKSSADTLEIAQWVFNQIDLASKEKEKKEKKDDKKGDKGSEKPENGPSSPDQGEGEGEGAGESDKPSKGPSGPVKSPHNVEAKEVEPKLSEGGIMGNFCSEPMLVKRGDEGNGCFGRTNEIDPMVVPAKLRYEVKRLFENSGVTEFSRNRKAGSVNVHALPSVGAGNDRVFKRRLDVEGIDSAVVILLDVSGSMFGDDNRINPAVQATRALLETLSSAGVNIAVLAFGSMVYEVKSFDTNHRKVSARLPTIKPLGGTNDYAALRYAHQILAKRNERRKIVFVVTDGRGDPDAVRQQVNSGNAFGVTTIGVGIKSSVSDIYPNSVTVHDIADLGNASFKQIKLAA